MEKGGGQGSPRPTDGGTEKVHSPARAQELSHGSHETPIEVQEATPMPSGFGMPPASLPEDT